MPIGVLILAEGLGKFGWMKLNVEVMSHRYLHVDTQVGDVMIAVTLKTQAFSVETPQVGIIDED